MTPSSPFVSFETGISATGPWDQILPGPLLQPHLLRNPAPLGSDAYWMTEAWNESLKNHGLSQPNPLVGCVLVDSKGTEISRGATHPYPGIHAEKAAFNQVQNPQSLIGATAYITLEPCSHQGRNPPCADLLASSGISRVVIARTDPNPQVNGEGIKKLLAAGKKLDIGVLAREITAWNLGFFTQQILRRPLIALKWAQTLDGQLADDSMTSQWISSSTSRAYAHWLRQNYDLVLVGAKTVATDHPQLGVRECLRPHQAEPLPIILDSSGLLFNQKKETQALLKTKTLKAGRKCVLITTSSTLKRNPNSWLQKLEDLVILEQPENTPIAGLMETLSGPDLKKILGRPVQSLLIEGGSQTLTRIISAGYGDIFHVFVAPTLTGGEKNRIAIQKLLHQATRLKTISTAQLESDILIEMISEEIENRIF